jgi:hypothetical protein
MRVVVAMMDMELHLPHRVLRRFVLVNPFKPVIEAIFQMQSIQILHPRLECLTKS